MSNQETADPVNFRAISPQDFAAMDPATKDRVVRSRHLGIIRASEEKISAFLTDAFKTAQQMPDGSIRPWKHEELVVVLMHREDPITPPELKATWEAQNIEVGIMVSKREEFALGIGEYVARQCVACKGYFADGSAICPACNAPANPASRTIHPYRKASEVLRSPSPPNTIFVSVFDCGMCTVTFLGFNVADPTAETVPADPNFIPPRAVEPLQKIAGSGNADS